MALPFSRVQAMYALIEAAMASAKPTFALSQLPAYGSRGHGRSKPFIKSWFSHTSRRGVSTEKPPINSPRECARRLAHGCQ